MTIVSYYTKVSGNPTSGYDQVTTPWRRLHSTKQKRPYVNGPFDSAYISGSRNVENSQNNRGNAKMIVFQRLDLNAPKDDLATIARVKAYSKLMGEALPRAAMLVNMAQIGQSWEMIVERTLQLVRAYKALRRGNLSQFAKELYLSPKLVNRKITRKRARQDASGAWLEFTFGWMPLISDVYNAIDVLQTNFPVEPIRSGSRASAIIQQYDTYDSSNITKVVRARLKADMVVTNPNLLLANQLGLLNPAAVVWDIIPFSFVVDWFLPVGKFISTFNDQAGIQLLGQCTTLKYVVTVDRTFPGPYQPTGVSHADGKRVIRLAENFIKPQFPTKLKLPTESLWLAATSVSLLIQVFGGKK